MKKKTDKNGWVIKKSKKLCYCPNCKQKTMDNIGCYNCGYRDKVLQNCPDCGRKTLDNTDNHCWYENCSSRSKIRKS